MIGVDSGDGMSVHAAIAKCQETRTGPYHVLVPPPLPPPPPPPPTPPNDGPGDDEPLTDARYFCVEL